jgi:hypothetical protein
MAAKDREQTLAGPVLVGKIFQSQFAGIDPRRKPEKVP